MELYQNKKEKITLFFACEGKEISIESKRNK